MAGKKTRWAKRTIKGVYPGTKSKDTAIGEFRPDLEEHNCQRAKPFGYLSDIGMRKIFPNGSGDDEGDGAGPE